MNPIADHLSRQVANDARKSLICDCFLDEQLFIWNYPYLFNYYLDQIIRRCILNEPFQNVPSFFHGQSYGGHFSGKKDLGEILRSGFYQPTLVRDVYEYYKRCLHHHQMGKIGRKYMMLLTSIIVVDIYYVWGIDFMGPLPSFGNEFKLFVC